MTFFLLFLSCVELSSKYAIGEDGERYSELQGDCDDANRFINPEATEYCDGINNGCDTIVDQDREWGIQTMTKMDTDPQHMACLSVTGVLLFSCVFKDMG